MPTFSSQRSRWRWSVMRRDRHWERCLATAANACVRASIHHDADPTRLQQRRPCGSRRTRRRSARAPEGQPEAPGVGPRRPRWSGPDPMVVWNGSRPSRAAGAAPITASQTRKIPASRAAKFLGGQLDGHSPVYCVFYWFFLRAASYWASKSLAAAPYTSISRKRRRLRNLLEL